MSQQWKKEDSILEKKKNRFRDYLIFNYMGVCMFKLHSHVLDLNK